MTGVKAETEHPSGCVLDAAPSQHLPRSNMPFRAGTPISVTPRVSQPPASINGGTPFSADLGNQANTNDDVDVPDITQQTVMHTLGNHSRELIKFIQKMEALNVGPALGSLPKFVIIGDQSAGKSSIIEAVCDIFLPRSEGTCTRCPFQITTIAKDGPWVCRIQLQQKYTYDASIPKSRAKKSGSTFNNWMAEADPYYFDFATIHSKDQLGVALCRAQLAILNPSQHPSYYTNAPVAQDMKHEAQEVGFSPNVIHLEITATGLPQFWFYDLPGAINTTSDESQEHLVHFVEQLLKTYIQDKGTFILLACAANQDLETSTALKFLRQCKATPRSMVILTKPDLMEPTEKKMKDLKQLLLGAKGYYTFGDGCFVTRQLSQKQLDGSVVVTYEEARRMEAEFFAKEPWSTTLAAHADRFGIPKLQRAVSQKLTEHILHSLPDLVERVQAQLCLVNGQLSTFPAKAITPHITVHTEISNVTKAIADEINADSSKSTFRKTYRNVFHNLKVKLAKGKPAINFNTPGYEKPSISLDSSEPEETPTKFVRNNDGRSMGNTPGSSSLKSARRRKTPATTRGAGDADETEVVGKVIFELDAVKARFDAAPSADIPGQVSETVMRALMIETLTGWRCMTDQSMEQLKARFEEMLESCVHGALVRYTNTKLLRDVSSVTKALLTELMDETMFIVSALLASEMHRPLTYNKEYLSEKKLDFEATHQKIRRLRRTDEYFDTREAQGYKVPVKAEQHKKADAEWARATLGPDEYDREVKALAIPLAYYDISSANLVDAIAKYFEHGLMFQYENCISQKLLTDLNAYNTDHCRQLLADDPAREHKRMKLEEEKKKLENALTELHDLHSTNG